MVRGWFFLFRAAEKKKETSKRPKLSHSPLMGDPRGLAPLAGFGAAPQEAPQRPSAPVSLGHHLSYDDLIDGDEF